jgi:tetratricopeptide (TPR) repeat protein
MSRKSPPKPKSAFPPVLRDGSAVAAEVREIVGGAKQTWPIRSMVDAPGPATLKADSDPRGEAGRARYDATGVARNRLHLARSELAQGHAAAALLALPRNLSLESSLLQAQAELALNRLEAAQQSLAAANAQCAACPQLASLRLLQARVALTAQRAAEALAHAEAALKLLRDGNEAAETGNAWRLIAAARLATGDAAGALPAAGAALDIDRRMALPEKIARDWLLIGDIRKALGAPDTATAYRRAADVAHAAGLAEIIRLAEQALAGTGPANGSGR